MVVEMKYGDLTGQIAVVTGGGRGIGEAICRILAEYGATVAVADINPELAEGAAAALRQEGFIASSVSVDVGTPASITAMVERIMKKYGRIDILVNNAGVLDATPALEMTVEGWDRVVDIDMRGTHLCTQAVLPHMIQAKRGRIVNIASQAGQLGGFLAGINYTSAKGGVIAMTKAYARMAGPHNITVNAVSPGFISTDMTNDRSDNSEEIPLRRLGTALDTAKAVYFLASDLADYVTGATIDLNGGYYMR